MVPVIFCTAYAVSTKEGKAMGANDVVIKSSDLSELKLKIRKVLQSKIPTLRFSTRARVSAQVHKLSNHPFS
jgi:DNA-binding response OmpR family regulator